jgi:putative DNA primase/helicase
MMSRDGVMIGDTQDAPLWRGKNNTNATDIFAAKNGLFNLKNGDFTPHDHTYFSLGASDFNFQHGAQCPNWEAWLAKVFIKDQAQIRLLQEWFGYCLTYDCSQRKVMLLLGITTSGKGTILNILTSLLGRKNMVACEPVDTTEKWFGATIFGKRLVNFFDLRMGGRLDTTAFGSVILKLAEGAPTKIEQKGKPIFTAPTFAKVTIASNNLPRFVDSSSAVAGRFLSLRFTESFLGREDKGLDARLNAELPGIFLWALAGLERLRDNEWRWTIHNAGESIRSQMADDCSPVRRFVDDECIIDPDSETEKQNLFKFWKVYCAERNIQNIGTDAIFSTKLHDAFPQLEHGRPSKDGKYLPRTHIGIRIKYSHE